MAFRKRVLWVAAALLPVLVVVGVARWRPDAEQAILLELSQQRPANGRLFRASSPERTSIDESILARAQVFALSLADPVRRDRIQSLIDLARDRPQTAVETLSRLSEDAPVDPEILNDLGVAILTQAEERGVNYFKALTRFQAANRLAPLAPAPLYNLACVYRLVGLTDLAADARMEFEKVDGSRRWMADLEPRQPAEYGAFMDRLRKMLATGGKGAADRLFAADVPAYRRAVTDFALRSSDATGNDPAAQYVADRLRSDYKDETVAAMLEPLWGSNAKRVLESRRLVQAAILKYRRSRFEESVDLYDQARTALGDVASPFDRIWIEINQADAEIKLKKLDLAVGRLARIVPESRERHYQWVLGHVFTAQGADLGFAKGHDYAVGVLREAVAVFERIESSDDAARALYYLGLWQSLGGDDDGSIELLLQSFRATHPDDHLRLSQLDSMLSRGLFRSGYLDFAAAYQQASVSEAGIAENTSLVAAGMADMATIDLSRRDYDQARKQISMIERIIGELDDVSREQLEYRLNLICGRMNLAEGRPETAVECLKRNQESLDSQPRPLNYYGIPTMQLLAQAYSDQGNVARAREYYERAARTVENDDNYLKTASTRAAFEVDRRDLYELAVSFEYERDEQAAWRYVQRYRSKLFLEFLGQMNPMVGPIHEQLAQHKSAEVLAPAGLQVIEYFTLNDRILIWLTTHKETRPFQVSVSRDALERKVAELLSRIREREDVEKRLEELYGLLIAPARAHLVPGKTLAIIPDQSLHRLPMAALRQSSSSKYLGEEYPILESPDLTTLLVSSAAVVSRDHPVIWGANRVDAVAAGDVDDFLRTYGTGLAGDTTGTKEKFFDQMESASILHFAGHSVDAPDPLRSAILLDGRQGSANSVTAAEISRQRMRRDALVVLASCDSSVGNARDGVGIRGLTSAFLIAGAGSVTGSLWPVDDASTSSLMRAFHREYAAGTSAVEALRLAQVSFIAQNPDKAHPFYWSGFVVNGNLSAFR
ncbi:MAG TPA: CHAT domain-containing protein [Terriglobia bacterium]|nr:CHAT domain-containing protein [Terriglobia bacterium]